MPDRTPSGSAPPRGAGRTIKTILKLYFIKNKLKEFDSLCGGRGKAAY